MPNIQRETLKEKRLSDRDSGLSLRENSVSRALSMRLWNIAMTLAIYYLGVIKS
jgi:hypothetical protein